MHSTLTHYFPYVTYIMLRLVTGRNNTLGFPEEDVIDCFHAHLNRVVHVPHLISPSPETPTGVNPLAQKVRLNCFKGAIAIECGDRIRVRHITHIAGDHEVTVGCF